MKNSFIKISGTLLIILFTVLNAYAEKGSSVTILGPGFVNVNDVKIYYAEPSLGVIIYAGTWSVTGGTIQSQSTTSATILWTSVGTRTVTYQATSTNVGFLLAKKTVIVSAAAPNPPSDPIIQSQVCNSAVLQSSGTAPSGETWYWQGTSSSGTSTSYNATSTYAVNSTGTYYIRSRDNTTGVWSGPGSVVVTLGTVGGTTWYRDVDGDSLGDPNTTLVLCTQPAGYVSNSNDQCPNDYGTVANNGCPDSSSLSNQNYIRSIAPQVSVSNLSELTSDSQSLQNITYFDGLGRPMQSIAIKQGGGTAKDIITPINYDGFGRQAKDYLPYVPAIAGNEGGYRAEALTATNTFYNTSKYENTTNPYSQKDFETSPLNRVLKQAAPGTTWAMGSGHEIKFDYQTNTGATEVRVFKVALSFASNTYTPSLIDNALSYYSIGTLTKTVTKDENWTSGTDRTTEEFKNKSGQVVLKRTYNAGAHDTYYIYDDYGNLTYVLPPKMEASTASIATLNSQFDELGYQYIYDKRNRLVEKKIPGKYWEYVIYDNLDRPVLTQDSLQRAKNPMEWLLTKYDVLGRVAYTGLFTLNSTKTSQQIIFDAKKATQNYETKVTSGTGYDNTYYTNTNYPNTNIEVLTVNYYDDYNFNLAGTFNPTTNNTLIEGVYPTTRTKGLATGSKVKVLTTSNWITTVSYYDEKARPIRTYSYNDYLKTTDVVSSKLDFVGKVDVTTSLHTNANGNLATITIVDSLFYDHAGRLTKQTQTINGSATEVIVENTYDELGQLISKGVGGKTTQNRLQTVDYTYNIRGWLKQINDPSSLGNDLFGFKLNYNNPTTGTALYNGNISQTQWRTANTDNSLKTYTYRYDALNRITGGLITNSNPAENNKHDLKLVEYDKNGNITKLTRNGYMSDGTFTEWLDYMTYNYDSGNKLVDILEEGHHYGGFADKTNTQTGDYVYDANGNMIIDKNKGITTNILYNYLNLPTQVTINGQNIMYTYDAAGTKLRKTVSGVTTDYANGFIYENNQLQFFNQPEGYVEPNGSGGFNYIYQYKDHLGNIRLSYNDIGSYKNIIDSDFTSSFDGWQENGTVNYSLDNGRLKVNVNSSWEGVKHLLNGFTTTAGKTLKVNITFDKGNTISQVRLYLHEVDSNGNLVRWNMINDNLQTGTYEYSHITVDTGNSIIFRIDKDNSYPTSATYFYIDQVSLREGDLQIKEENNYYPFGLKHKGYNNVQVGRDHKFGFGNKEEQDELGLGWIDITARNYDPALGRWMNIDPLAEGMRRHSPYNYAFDNPIFFIDSDGMAPTVNDGIFIDKDGNKIGEDAKGEADGKVFVVEGSSKRKVERATENGKTIETSELNESHELPNNDVKEEHASLVKRAEADDTREFSSTNIEQRDGTTFNHNVEGDEFKPGENAQIDPLKGLPADKKGIIKVVAHTHNVDPSKHNTSQKTFTASGKPSPADFNIAATSGKAINVVFDTRKGNVHLIKKTGRNKQSIKIKNAVYFKKKYN